MVCVSKISVVCPENLGRGSFESDVVTGVLGWVPSESTSCEDNFFCIDYLEGSFSSKEVWFKRFRPTVKTSCPLLNMSQTEMPLLYSNSYGCHCKLDYQLFYVHHLRATLS